MLFRSVIKICFKFKCRMSADFFAILMFVAVFEVSLYYEGDIKASQQVSQNLFAKIEILI